ncbi:GNAT family N-acetyltransferase [Aliiroseovarius sp. F20344]|uniref:GNAT family N-acetyltransferase n=1 Tax=Aliiroseovarius sp. F20344 TaxID=2926414 RepID=UPI001FF1DFA3|nr:GNAT family N-acetyltransferase [Aliiroseovarius sp. F20344]MCK0142915.1 GNAT family N-acetyltransferase [Aliiroseovarius sp. F20344]
MTLALDIPRLETDRLILRAPCEADVAAEAAFFASDASRFVGGPLREDETWRMVAMLLGHWAMRGYGFWGVEEKSTGAYVGHVGLWSPLGWPEPEIGWTLMNDATGKGYATEAATAARLHAYDVLGWSTAISLIDTENEGSKAVAKRLGAAFEDHFDHPGFGKMEIWRHPAADTDGGPEAYA